MKLVMKFKNVIVRSFPYANENSINSKSSIDFDISISNNIIARTKSCNELDFFVLRACERWAVGIILFEIDDADVNMFSKKWVHFFKVHFISRGEIKDIDVEKYPSVMDNTKSLHDFLEQALFFKF